MDPFDLRLWKDFAQAGGDAATPAVVDQISIDSRRIYSTNALFVPLPGTFCDGHAFIEQVAQSGVRYALARHDWHPARPIKNIVILRVEDPLKAFQEIAGAYRRHIGCRVIAIAGSYGKTMVKDLLYALASPIKPIAASPESFNSQIGVPLSLLTVGHRHEFALIEAGISKQNEMDALVEIIQPDGCIITHIGKKHSATLGELPSATTEILKLCTDIELKDWVLLPNVPHVQPFMERVKSKRYFWNEQEAALPHARSLCIDPSSIMPYCVDFPDGFRHTGDVTAGFYYFIDLLNIAVKAAWLLGIPSEAISATLHRYTPEPMRTEIWKSPAGPTFINDSYCSDPQSVDQALKHLEQAPENSRKVFVFGGMKGDMKNPESDYRRVGKAINRSKLDRLWLFGNHPFDPLIEEVKSSSPAMEITQCGNYSDAIHSMQNGLKQEDVVLVKGEKKELLDTLTEAFNDSICSNQCFINLAAIKSNLETIGAKLPKGTRIMVMVKALAYGTDDIRMAKFLHTCGIEILGVSYVDEAVALKRAGVRQDIFVINAASYEAAKVVKWDLQIGVSDPLLIETVAAEAAKQNKRIKVHLHIDTGMSRFGCRPEEALSLAALICSRPSLLFEGIMTHFACSDNPADDDFTMHQVNSFDRAIHELEAHGFKAPWKHAANSSAVMRFDFPQFNMVRIGLAVYGLYCSEAAKKALDLRLAFSLISRIVGINVCKAGETISYGRSYTVRRETQRIAVIPIGYFDGLHRNYSGKGQVIIRGKKAPMVAKICMDFMMVDISEIPSASIGDSVLIFGEDEFGHYLSPEDLAERGDSIVHELITCLGPRIQRIFVHEEAHKLR